MDHPPTHPPLTASCTHCAARLRILATKGPSLPRRLSRRQIAHPSPPTPLLMTTQRSPSPLPDCKCCQLSHQPTHKRPLNTAPRKRHIAQNP